MVVAVIGEHHMLNRHKEITRHPICSPVTGPIRRLRVDAGPLEVRFCHKSYSENMMPLKMAVLLVRCVVLMSEHKIP